MPVTSPNIAHIPWRVTNLTLDDTSFPLLQIAYIGDDAVHTAVIDADGSSGASQLLITLTDDSGAHVVDETVATDLQGVVDAINAFTDADGKKNWRARRHNGASDFSTAAATFIDTASFSVGRKWTNLLFRDASSYLTASCRISNHITPPVGSNEPSHHTDPKNDQPQGRIQILKVRGRATFASGTMTLTMSKDQGTSAASEKELETALISTTATEETIIDYTDGEVPTFSGPLLFELTGSAAHTAGSTSLKITWRPV